VDLAVPAEHAVAVYANRGIVTVATIPLAVSDTHDHVLGERDQPSDLGAVRVEQRSLTQRPEVVPVRRQRPEVTTDCRLGEDQQLRTPVPSRLHVMGDLGEALLQIPAERRGHRSYPDVSHRTSALTTSQLVITSQPRRHNW
jgi:hypothetical protein